METQTIKTDLKDRVETGPVQFQYLNDMDWKGIFIRGDHCFYYKILVDKAINGKLTEFDKLQLSGLSDLLGSSKE